MAGSTRTSTTAGESATGTEPTVAETTTPDTGAKVQKSEEKEGPSKVLHYVAPFNVTRVLSAEDFKKLNPVSQVKKTTWSADNNHRVDVSDWSDEDIKVVMESDSNFKLIEA